MFSEPSYLSFMLYVDKKKKQEVIRNYCGIEQARELVKLQVKIKKDK